MLMLVLWFVMPCRLAAASPCHRHENFRPQMQHSTVHSNKVAYMLMLALQYETLTTVTQLRADMLALTAFKWLK
jgi:hypothetical protein